MRWRRSLLVLAFACVAVGFMVRKRAFDGGFFMTGRSLEEFKARIGYDAISEPGPPEQGVVLAWPDPLAFLGLDRNGWNLVDDRAEPMGSGAAQREWVLGKGGARLVISAYVSSSGVSGARQRFLDVAANTMMVRIPYERGPGDLGTLSAISPGLASGPSRRGGRTVIWIFRNTCIHLRAIDDVELDLLKIAYDFQRLMERHLRPSMTSSVPRIARIDVSPPDAAVGQRVDVRVRVEPEAGASYFLHGDLTGDALDFVGEDGLALTFKAQHPGRAALHLVAIDRQTLLCASADEPIDVRASR